jgi:hypothetical protein
MGTKNRDLRKAETTWSVETRSWQRPQTVKPYRSCTGPGPHISPTYMPKTLVLPTCRQQSVQGNYRSRQSLVL